MLLQGELRTLSLEIMGFKHFIVITGTTKGTFCNVYLALHILMLYATNSLTLIFLFVNYDGHLKIFWEQIFPNWIWFSSSLEIWVLHLGPHLCVQAVETIIFPGPRWDLNCSRTWEPEGAFGFHWYWLRICPWVFHLGWDQVLSCSVSHQRVLWI